MSLKYSTLTIIGILGILINEVEKFNFVNWNSRQTFFGLNLKRGGRGNVKFDEVCRRNIIATAQKTIFKIYAKFAYINHHQIPIKSYLI